MSGPHGTMWISKQIKGAANNVAPFIIVTMPFLHSNMSQCMLSLQIPW